MSATKRLKRIIAESRTGTLRTIISQAESASKDNRLVQDHLSQVIKENEAELKSSPVFLRLIQEVYSYAEKQGESLSQVTEQLKVAQHAAEAAEAKTVEAADTAQKLQYDMATWQMIAEAGNVYLQFDVNSIADVYNMFDLSKMEEALSEVVTYERWQELNEVFKRVNEKRGNESIR